MKKFSSVVIIGRVNVGKSALFNRLTESTKALVSAIPGTTRDYNVARVAWARKNFDLIDTGGVNIDTLKNSVESLLNPKKIFKQSADEIELAIINQTKIALQKASLVLLVVDAQTGLLPEDKALALVVKKLRLPVLLVCNKVDNEKRRDQMAEFYGLGLGTVIPVSALNGSGSGDLLDEIVKRVKNPAGRPPKDEAEKTIRVAIVGKPNVGKSSLINQLLGEDRVIVSSIAHTTREPQDTTLEYQDRTITLIDTAGLRKKSKIDHRLEKLSTRKTIETIKRANIVLLVTEVNEPLTVQDSRLAGLLKNVQAGIIIAANKWDVLADKDQKIDTKVNAYYQRFFPFLAFAPLVFISAKTGRNVDTLLELFVAVYDHRGRTIDQADLDTVLAELLKKHRPAQAKGPSRPKLYSLIQTHVSPPEFTVTVGSRQSIHFSYLRFIENQLRQRFDFTGVPITIRVTAKRE